MNSTVWIVLIVAAAVIVILYMFRGTLSRFFLKANKEGLEAELETREPTDATSASAGKGVSGHSINISGNRQIGRDNEIAVERPGVNIIDNLQVGDEQTIQVEADRKKKK